MIGLTVEDTIHQQRACGDFHLHWYDCLYRIHQWHISWRPHAEKPRIVDSAGAALEADDDVDVASQAT